MRDRTTAIGWIASVMLLVQGPLLALGGGVGVGGFHGGSIGNAGNVVNRPNYPGGYYGYAMGPATVEGDEDLNPRGSGSAPPVAATGTGGGPPEELQDGTGIHVRKHAISDEGATWDSDWWAQDPRSEDEKAAAAARAEADPGVVVASLPRYYDTVYAADGPYYFAEGKFFQATESGYQVVAPPIGIEVKDLPPAAEMVKVNGQQYFVYNDIYYQALYGGSGIVYKVVADPNS
jgi:hypothetical protein